jgi:DNA-binding NtrC family response regulator
MGYENSRSNSQEIVGESRLLKRVLELAIKVARSDVPVLILGEAGSGKELIARAVHRISARKNESFVKVNCTTTAAGMLESKIFGHEMGAFDDPARRKIGGRGPSNLEPQNLEPQNLEPPNKEIPASDERAVFPPDHQPTPPGALTRTEFEQLESQLLGNNGRAEGESRKIGHIERANKGILFLDEIAHIPLGLQGKLLRVLERREFERLGSTRGIQVNVRLIAATRYDLGEQVAERKFRDDLYDQLNVFPIRVPPLRERRDDIPLLAHYFMQTFARRMNKHLESIPVETVNFLVNYDWPGNVRQLESLIERSVVLTKGIVLQVSLAGLWPESQRSVREVIGGQESSG